MSHTEEVNRVLNRARFAFIALLAAVRDAEERADRAEKYGYTGVLEKLTKRAEQAEAERDRETDLRRAAESHRDSMRDAYSAIPYADEWESMCEERDVALAEADRLREAMQGGVGLIATERSRQIEDERWTHYHDDGHEDGALALAAAVYALPEAERDQYIQVLVAASWTNRKLRFHLWPFGWNWFKPTPDDRVRELVKAGALIAAEIDRLARRALSAEQPEERR